MIVRDHILANNNNQLKVRELLFTENGYDAPTLVFLHDALGCIDSWKTFPEQLCSSLNINAILYDRVGHGQSSPFSGRRPLDYLEKEALEGLPKIIAHLEIEKPILLGCSDGASIALLHGASHPATEAIISIAAHIKVEAVTHTGIKNSLNLLTSSSFFKKLEALHGNKTQKLVDDWATIWLSPEFRNWDISTIIKDIQCPSLILQGKQDQYATEQHLKDIVSAIGSQAQGKMLEQVGHFPHLEKPEMLVSIIQQFLQSSLTLTLEHPSTPTP